jgi:hypothetical protein
MIGDRPDQWTPFSDTARAGDRDALKKPVFELNRQCIDLLVTAAAAETPELRLARQFQGPLRRLSLDARGRLAQQFYLLVDIRFTDHAWWRAALKHPTSAPLSAQAAFPKTPAIQIGRAAVLFLRHATELFGAEASFFGAHPSVLQSLSNMSLNEVDRLIDRFFKEVRPRWENRPAVWQSLIQSASTSSLRAKRDVDLRGLQLLVSQILE